MKISRQVVGNHKPLEIELSNAEMYQAYRLVLKRHEIEDIAERLSVMSQEDLYGKTFEDIVDDPELMEEIHDRFTNKQDCTVPYWDNIEAAIEYVLKREA